MTAFTKGEKAIAKSLGLTPFRLRVLTRFAKPNPPKHWGDVAGTFLQEAGYLREATGSYREITEAGRALVAEARRLGW